MQPNLTTFSLEKREHMISNNIDADYIIVGCGVSGLFCALNLPSDSHIIMISKDSFEKSDSFLAQGGICVLRSQDDYNSYFHDTMKAGHFENNPDSVQIMIQSSPDTINELIDYGVEFQQQNGHLLYTKEGAHSKPRILYHEDITGKEITSKLLAAVRKCTNIEMFEYVTMKDLIIRNHSCHGIITETKQGDRITITAANTILATGGIGGTYKHSTNFPHLTGDSIKLAQKYHIQLQDLDYVQIHPTTLYSEKPGRRFLISESVRGEGALLYNKNMERFVNELLPRDLLTIEIKKQMQKDNMPYVWLSLAPLSNDIIMQHFPNIYRHCLEEGYDVTKECIPVVPAQHYFMGGIKVNQYSRTSMNHLYAVGETACNGVHGKNRLASNSLLESLVFAKRAAYDMTNRTDELFTLDNTCCSCNY